MAPTAKPITLPPFQSRNLKFWFVQAEAMFRNGNVTSEQAKYDYVLAAMDVTAACNIQDLIDNPPEEDQYATLKQTLMDRLAEAEQTRIQRLLSSEPIGDRRPSQFLRHLQSLAGDNFSAAAVRTIWLDSLPSDVNLIVAGASAKLTQDEASAMADNVYDVAMKRRSVAAVSINPPVASSSSGSSSGSKKADRTAALEKQIAALTKRLDRVTRERNKQPAGGSPAKQKRKNSPPPQQQPDDTVCWYHRRFKDQATKCTKPCNWVESEESGNGSNQQ